MPSPPSDRVAEVRAALSEVTDPELDESVVELGFIARIDVAGDKAEIEFRLPTFWCSASFAWMMAEDMRTALAALLWLDQADIRLVDHFAAERINAGIAANENFAGTFVGEAGGDLNSLRETFRRKAFLGRMSRVIEALRHQGHTDAGIVAMSIGELRALASVVALAERYLALRSAYGGSAGPGDAAFRRPDGGEIATDDLPAFLREIRMTRRGVEANGEMCRILLQGRYGERRATEAPAYGQSVI